MKNIFTKTNNMGCCASRTDEIQKLEKELNLLLLEKNKLENLIEKEKKVQNPKFNLETTTDTGIVDYDSLLDKDQLITSKIIECFQECLSSETEADTIKSYFERFTEMKSLAEHEKMSNLTEFKLEEIEIQSKIFEEIEGSKKLLVQMVDKKFYEINERKEYLHTMLTSDEHFSESLASLDRQIESIPNSYSHNFRFLLRKYSLLDEIEKTMFSIEKSIPALHEYPIILEKFKEIEQILSDLTKKSYSVAKCIQTKFGNNDLSPPEDIAEQSVVIKLDTFVSIPESIISSLNTLMELENAKERVVNDNRLLEELLSLKNELMEYLQSSAKNKDEACLKANRVPISKNKLSRLIDEILQNPDKSVSPLLTTLQALKEKTINLLKCSMQQDQDILAMITKFASLEKNIDEIELRIDEMVISAIKDLNSSVSYVDSASKAELDELQKMFIGLPAETPNDLFDHITSLQRKIELTPKIEGIRTVIRESQANDMIKIKSEFQDKINQLSDHVALVETEKKSLESSIVSCKINCAKPTKISKNLIQACKDKDLEISELKNILSCAQEQYENLNREYTSSQHELNDFSNKNIKLTENLRAKELELSGLNDKLLGVSLFFLIIVMWLF